MYDTDKVAIAADLNARLLGWVVIWGPYRRKYSAFGACTLNSTIIDDPDRDSLIDRMRNAQLAAVAGLSGRPAGGGL